MRSFVASASWRHSSCAHVRSAFISPQSRCLFVQVEKVTSLRLAISREVALRHEEPPVTPSRPTYPVRAIPHSRATQGHLAHLLQSCLWRHTLAESHKLGECCADVDTAQVQRKALFFRQFTCCWSTRTYILARACTSSCTCTSSFHQLHAWIRVQQFSVVVATADPLCTDGIELWRCATYVTRCLAINTYLAKFSASRRLLLPYYLCSIVFFEHEHVQLESSFVQIMDTCLF